MAELELTRSSIDRRLFELEGVGTLRFRGMISPSATAEAGGRQWRIARVGFWRRSIEATDETGEVVGHFDPHGFRRGGTLRWGARDLALRAASSWRERYALVEEERELALLDGKDWGRRPVKVVVDDAAEVEPGLLLFAVFVVRGLADDASGAAATVTVINT